MLKYLTCQRTSQSTEKASDAKDRSYQGDDMTADRAQTTPWGRCVRVAKFFYKR